MYETLLTCDYAAHTEDLPRMAGVDAAEWERLASGLVAEVSDGRLSLAKAYERMLVAAGRTPDLELVERMLHHDQQCLVASARLFDDTMPFLTRLREQRIKVALVSNCAESTRPLLEHLGLIELVDEVILSCEVGAAKPSTDIYLAAVNRLGVLPPQAVLIDDQPTYCAGARAAGLGAIRIIRDGPKVGPDSVNSLLEVEIA